MKKIVLVLAVFVFITDIYAQVEKYNLPPGNFYKKSKVSLVAFKKFEASNLSIKNDSIYFINEVTRADEKFSVGEINYLRVQEGTQAGMWALYGGLLMGVSCLCAVIEIEADPYSELKEDAGIIIVGFIAGGTVIGALIGSAIPKWKTYYVHKDMSIIESVNLDLYADTKSIGIKLRFLLE